MLELSDLLEELSQADKEYINDNFGHVVKDGRDTDDLDDTSLHDLGGGEFGYRGQHIINENNRFFVMEYNSDTDDFYEIGDYDSLEEAVNAIDDILNDSDIGVDNESLNEDRKHDSAKEMLTYLVNITNSKNEGFLTDFSKTFGPFVAESKISEDGKKERVVVYYGGKLIYKTPVCKRSDEFGQELYWMCEEMGGNLGVDIYESLNEADTKEFETTKAEVEQIIDDYLSKCNYIDVKKDGDSYIISYKVKDKIFKEPSHININEFKDGNPERNIVEVKLSFGDEYNSDSFDTYFNYEGDTYNASKNDLIWNLENIVGDKAIESMLNDSREYESFRKKKPMKKEIKQLDENDLNSRLVKSYRKYARLKDEDEITEDLDDWALNCVSSRSGYDKEDLKDLLLKRGK